MDQPREPMRLHVYTKVSLACAVVGSVINATVGFLLYGVSWPLSGVLVDNIGITGILALISVCLGAHAIIKHEWPGPTVIERVRKPRARDVTLVVFALFLTLVNVTAAATFVVRSDPFAS